MVQVSVVGDHSSAGRIAADVLVAAVVGPPPVTSTDPSGSMVALWYARLLAIDATCRQVGVACVMSRT